MIVYNHQEVEKKWQQVWAEIRLNMADISKARKPFYNLMMFPYPSAEGLHVGNMYAFTVADIYGRFKRLQGYDVFEPIGLDGFGIHSENYALKVGRHPKDHAAITEKNFYSQLHKIGCMYDWSRTVETYHPDYYKWTQWLFIKMWQSGLAYRGKAKVNWCPTCKTVLSDEQVIDGKCERTGDLVAKREMEQWFFRITAYADRLLANLALIDWPEKIKIAQRNWIGRKEGATIKFKVQPSSRAQVEGSPKSTVGKERRTKNNELMVEIFTTRPDTVCGVTFIALSPRHPLVDVILEQRSDDRILQDKILSLRSRTENGQGDKKDKEGVDTGWKAVNPVSREEIPIWVTDYVLASAGTGAIMGVPAHDERDFEFAQKFSLTIKEVIVPTKKSAEADLVSRTDSLYAGEGILVNSGRYNNLESEEAREEIIRDLEKRGLGKKSATYHLRDWLISRQRYWEAPIPMIFCQRCASNKMSFRISEARSGISKNNSGFRVKPGMTKNEKMYGWFPVPEEQLPVLLPDISDYVPEGNGRGPLAKHPEFYKTECPNCGGDAERETDVCDTFLDSSWYFLRYPSVGSPTSGQAPFDKGITKKWLPVAMYTGGAEHAVLHLLYARFVTMVLKDRGLVHFEEPFSRFFAHGLLIKEGAKMSKSKGNIINPDDYIAKYGADALRLYLMFMGPVDQGGDFRDTAMAGMKRWTDRVYRLITDQVDKLATGGGERQDYRTEVAFLVAKTSRDLESRRYNTAIAQMMTFVNGIDQTKVLDKEVLEKFLVVLSPFAPHLAEELWQRLVHGSSFMVNSDASLNNGRMTENFVSVHQQQWPKINKEVSTARTLNMVAVQINGKTRAVIPLTKEAGQESALREARNSSKVARHLEGKNVIRTIYIPGKTINFVVN